jgi:hypothetical protein
MLYEVCSYQLDRVVSSEEFTDFCSAYRAYLDWSASLSTDKVVIWERSQLTDDAKVIREALVIDLEDGSRRLTLTFGV